MERATEALGRAGGKKTPSVLADLALEGPTRRLREAAVASLAALGTDPVAQAAGDWAKQARGREPLRAVQALATLAREAGADAGDVTRQALDRALSEGSVPVRVAAARGLRATLDKSGGKSGGKSGDKPGDESGTESTKSPDTKEDRS